MMERAPTVPQESSRTFSPLPLSTHVLVYGCHKKVSS